MAKTSHVIVVIVLFETAVVFAGHLAVSEELKHLFLRF